MNATRVPYFTASVFLENKAEIGRVDDVFGPVAEPVRVVDLFLGFISLSF